MKIKKIIAVAVIASVFCTTQNSYSQQGYKGSMNYGSRIASYETGTVPLKSGIGNSITVQGIYGDDCDVDNTVIGLEMRGYKVYFNGTGPVGTTPTFYQGNATIFHAFNGPINGYIAADYNAVASGDIDNWLVTPAIPNVDSADVFSFYSRSPVGSTWPDSIMVMYSDVGDSIPSASSWVELGNFKVNILGIWEKMTFPAPSAGANARFAIRYKVIDGGPAGANSNYIGIDQIALNPPTNAPANNDCPDAININSALGLAIGTTTALGPYDNTTATTSALDPTTGFQCFGEPDRTGSNPSLDNTLWFNFIGDGSTYLIETADGSGITNYLDDGDTQFALYTGSCGSLVPADCNEDGPSSGAGGQPPYPAGFTVTTTAGVLYSLLIDGFNFNGALSTGEYYLEVTKLSEITCTDSSVTPGTNSANVAAVCENDTVFFTIAGAITPNASGLNGQGWIWSTDDISGSLDPTNEPSMVAQTVFISPAPYNLTRGFINNGAFVGVSIPYGPYYFTPVIFSNATAINTPANYLWDLQLDPNCTFTGNSVLVDIRDPNDPACATGVNDLDSDFGISNIYPVPVTDNITFTVSSKVSGKVIITISDAIGRQVINETTEVVAGEKQFTFDVKNLYAGAYFITLTSDKSSAVSRFIKK